jgi:hypothetical protein
MLWEINKYLTNGEMRERVTAEHLCVNVKSHDIYFRSNYWPG